MATYTGLTLFTGFLSKSFVFTNVKLAEVFLVISIVRDCVHIISSLTRFQTHQLRYRECKSQTHLYHLLVFYSDHDVMPIQGELHKSFGEAKSNAFIPFCNSRSDSEQTRKKFSAPNIFNSVVCASRKEKGDRQELTFHQKVES